MNMKKILVTLFSAVASLFGLKAFAQQPVSGNKAIIPGGNIPGTKPSLVPSDSLSKKAISDSTSAKASYPSYTIPSSGLKPVIPNGGFTSRKDSTGIKSDSTKKTLPSSEKNLIPKGDSNLLKKQKSKK
jgi:hypothetical protein